MKGNNYSIIRGEEYRRLSKIVLNGSVLDIGGSTHSGYHELLKGRHKITTVNIDASYGCDLVFDAQKGFPLEDETFDNIISLNVLEHIFNFHNVFSESARVLKKGGTIIISTPFLFHVHGSPDDYFRYTKSALLQLLTDAGFEDIQVGEIGQGLFSLFFQTIGGVLPFSSLRVAGKELSIMIDRFLCRHSKRYTKFAECIPLGYFVTAKKK